MESTRLMPAITMSSTFLVPVSVGSTLSMSCETKSSGRVEDVVCSMQPYG